MKWFDLPPIWLLAFAIAAWFSRTILSFGTGLTWGLGTAMVGAGLILMAAAIVQMRRHKTTVVPHRDPDALVSTGVFGLSRNPIYLADAVILAGLSLRWDAPLGLLLVPAFVRVIQTRFIHAEEARLLAHFPDAFPQYARKTRRWL